MKKILRIYPIYFKNTTTSYQKKRTRKPTFLYKKCHIFGIIIVCNNRNRI